jgi:hypothetical protein
MYSFFNHFKPLDLNRVSFGILALLATQPAWAIKGTYLPESELNKSTCQIKVGKLWTIYTPTHRNARATAKPLLKT